MKSQDKVFKRYETTISKHERMSMRLKELECVEEKDLKHGEYAEMVQLRKDVPKFNGIVLALEWVLY